MALVTVEHWGGFGHVELIRVSGFRDATKAAEYVAEQETERIGTARGGDGNGYWDGEFQNYIDVTELYDGQYLISFQYQESPEEPLEGTDEYLVVRPTRANNSTDQKLLEDYRYERNETRRQRKHTPRVVA